MGNDYRLWLNTSTASTTWDSSDFIIGIGGGSVFTKPAKPAEPAPSTPMAWLDGRIAHVTKKGRELLEAA